MYIWTLSHDFGAAEPINRRWYIPISHWICKIAIRLLIHVNVYAKQGAVFFFLPKSFFSVGICKHTRDSNTAYRRISVWIRFIAAAYDSTKVNEKKKNWLIHHEARFWNICLSSFWTNTAILDEQENDAILRTHRHREYNINKPSGYYKSWRGWIFWTFRVAVEESDIIIKCKCCERGFVESLNRVLVYRVCLCRTFFLDLSLSLLF